MIRSTHDANSRSPDAADARIPAESRTTSLGCGPFDECGCSWFRLSRCAVVHPAKEKASRRKPRQRSRSRLTVALTLPLVLTRTPPAHLLAGDRQTILRQMLAVVSRSLVGTLHRLPLSQRCWRTLRRNWPPIRSIRLGEALRWPSPSVKPSGKCDEGNSTSHRVRNRVRAASIVQRIQKHIG